MIIAPNRLRMNMFNPIFEEEPEDLSKVDHCYLIEYVASRTANTVRTTVEGLIGTQLVSDLKLKVADKLSIELETFSLKQDGYYLQDK